VDHDADADMPFLCSFCFLRAAGLNLESEKKRKRRRGYFSESGVDMQGQLKASRCKNIKLRTTREEHIKTKQHKSKYTKKSQICSGCANMQALMSNAFVSTTNFLEKHRVMETMTEASSAIQAEVTKALAESTSTSTSSLLPGAACLELAAATVHQRRRSRAGVTELVYPQSLTLKNPKKATQLPPSCHSGAPLGF
jgi:hypothetical protein